MSESPYNVVGMTKDKNKNGARKVGVERGKKKRGVKKGEM
jgi:hypothetical protein